MTLARRPWAILTVVLALSGCRQILGLEEPSVAADASVDAMDASAGDPCDYEFELTIPASGNFSGLATAGGVLYGFDLTQPARRIVSLDDTGERTLVQSVSFASAGLAASATHLYADDEEGGQIIHEISIADPNVQRELASNITGGNRGLAVIGDRILHLGALGSVVGFSQIRISDGAYLSQQPALDAQEVANADADGAHLVYVTSAFVAQVHTGTLHVRDLSGAMVCSRALPLPAAAASNFGYDVTGLAGDGQRLYVYDRLAAAIYVLAAP